ncbi:pyridoxal phosphate-dependent transferase [Lentinula guzmanii]|uniref:Pyridoxal phosphate-dependent transferase n=1 Tax=Lentinula guzmanii TaxID=2804957 RepID=A0AA38JX23_9AGAR|nr:pyridoxal phosphate-dependent transferase [Lentinula guzmanii]
MLLQRNPPLDHCIPLNTPHSVIQSLPTWQDNVYRAIGRQTQNGFVEACYPRFVIHPFVRPLIKMTLEVLRASPEQTCLLFPSLRLAKAFRSFMYLQFPSAFSEHAEIHRVSETLNSPPGYEIFAVLFRIDQQRMAMKFWTFSGAGISTRLAENCTSRQNGNLELTLGLPTELDHEYSNFYNSHTALTSVSEAKAKIKKLYAGLDIDSGVNTIRGVEGVQSSDVFLYPTGMNAIWNVHQMLHDVCKPNGDTRTFMTAQVNVLYVDSYKFLDTTSPGYHFFTNETLDDLERLLSGDTNGCAVLGIFTDFPGNPHLKSADLPRLRKLADKHKVPIIIDETAGCHLNVSVLRYADIVIGSLTKVFSGFANVLGGALLLNPHSPFYTRFKAHLDITYEDDYFGADALVMELNSRGFKERLAKINSNAEILADWLHVRSKVGGMENAVIEEVFYPKYQCRENYERCMRIVSESTTSGDDSLDGKNQDQFTPGYSGIVALSFTSLEAAKTFYESIQCYKGTTLGTVVTLLSPFIAIAFPPEKMDWVREHGMSEALVRFSVGVEDISRILNSVEAALFAAERC